MQDEFCKLNATSADVIVNKTGKPFFGIVVMRRRGFCCDGVVIIRFGSWDLPLAKMNNSCLEVTYHD